MQITRGCISSKSKRVGIELPTTITGSGTFMTHLFVEVIYFFVVRCLSGIFQNQEIP
jgi:hypothetical protein